MEQHICGSEAETISLGYRIGQRLPASSIVCLFGNLGAGKTTLIKGLAAGAADIEIHSIQSPTFVYLNIYHGKKTVYHFDLYRLQNVEEFLAMGFDEFLFSDGITCIEWSERIAGILPPHCVPITLRGYEDPQQETQRLITIGSVENYD